MGAVRSVAAGRMRLGDSVRLQQLFPMRISRFRRPLFAVFFAVAIVARAESPAPSFRVGTAKREITPKEPLPMWGYGARHDALSAGTLDPLYATALVIEAGTNKVAVVGLDLGRSPAEKSLQNIRQRLKAESGIEYSFIAGSHTHHGPVLELSDAQGKGKGKFASDVSRRKSFA